MQPMRLSRRDRRLLDALADAPPPDPWRRVKHSFGTAVYGYVLCLLVAGYLAVSGAEDPPPPPPAVDAVLHTPGGVSALVAAVRAEFGTAEVVGGKIHAGHAVVYRPVPGAPDRASVYGYKDGLTGWNEEIGRDPRLPLVDLAGIDPGWFARLVRDAPATVGVEAPAEVVAYVGDDGAGPHISVSVMRDLDGGILRARMNGEIVRVDAF